MNRQRALDAIRLLPTDRIPHWESLSNPRFEELVTGIDPWQHPRGARERMLELIPQDVGSVPLSDDPIERLVDDQITVETEDGARAARWGAGHTWAWDWGKHFSSIDDVLAYDPMVHLDQRGANINGDHDFRLTAEQLATELQAALDAQRAATGERALVVGGFYNTLFMWPLLTFGWELFLEVAGLHPEAMARLLLGFAHRSRLIFQAYALTDVEVFTSHDDICYARGPVFSPRWLRQNIYPFYEEFWSYLRGAGKKVIFICDGDVTRVADDIFACGADGIRSEPFTDWAAIADKHPDKVLVGDGDNRVVQSGDREAIFDMVARMTELGRRCPGYFYDCGNHLPWNVPAEAIQMYFDASDHYGWRR
jgi:hypothetical protein